MYTCRPHSHSPGPCPVTMLYLSRKVPRTRKRWGNGGRWGKVGERVLTRRKMGEPRCWRVTGGRRRVDDGGWRADDGETSAVGS